MKMGEQITSSDWKIYKDTVVCPNEQERDGFEFANTLFRATFLSVHYPFPVFKISYAHALL